MLVCRRSRHLYRTCLNSHLLIEQPVPISSRWVHMDPLDWYDTYRWLSGLTALRLILAYDEEHTGIADAL